MAFSFSSGLESLDEVLNGILAGDNVVWQIDDLADSPSFITPFYKECLRENKTLIYFRFAEHERLIPSDPKVREYALNPRDGFEIFISEILKIIENTGPGACYIFDSLSGLAVDWFSDRMLGNFFKLTCPYLYRFDTVAYFILLRNSNTPLAVNAIHNTAQVVLDVYKSDSRLYLLPIKVQERYSSTMYMLHSWGNENIFQPVLKSVILSDILSKVPQNWLDGNIASQDTWTNIFKKAQAISLKKRGSRETALLKAQLIKMMMTRDEELFPLCAEYFELPDLISFGKRMIGTGLIGGKSVGMLLSRNILIKNNAKWSGILETHDSFFIGADVFYTYIIENDCWWDKREIIASGDLITSTEKIQKKLLNGRFSSAIVEQFKEMLNYFGQSPIIVRSSSLLEDAYGNAFSGKYESVFCVNQGSPEIRLNHFIEAVRKVYASTMSADALSYRASRGLLKRDEQMALLIQRVSGGFCNDLYFPHIAGVGYSYNPFVWNTSINPQDGVLRIVFGLGTRAVDRHDNDYTRVVAINAPFLRPEGSADETRKYTQKIVDVLDLHQNMHTSKEFEKVIKNDKSIPLEVFANRDTEMEEKARSYHLTDFFPWSLSFKALLSETDFLQDIKEVLKLLSGAYVHPVDIEFTVNFLNNKEYRINLLQCRPFQFSEESIEVEAPENIPEERIILKTCGPIIGQSICKKIHRIIYVVPEAYSDLNTSKRYSTARRIGELTNLNPKDTNVMLIGPGRWGSRMPELGVPVSFSEIKNVSVLCELVKMHAGLTPDISLGTHFFNDLVELKIIYMGLFPDNKNYIFREDLLMNANNLLTQILPDAGDFKDVLRVIDTSEIAPSSCLSLYVNTVKQEGILFSFKQT